MKRPYHPGQALAWLDPVPDGIRLHRAIVLHIEPTSDQRNWWITTDRGDTTVDDTGNSGRVLPIDVEIARELLTRGDGYLILPSYCDPEAVLQRNSAESDLDLDADLGDDCDFD